MDDYVEISHDAFGRFSIVREVVYPFSMNNCQWCGNRNGFGSLFHYGVLPDDRLSGKIDWIYGNFCSINCMRVYHNL